MMQQYTTFDDERQHHHCFWDAANELAGPMHDFNGRFETRLEDGERVVEGAVEGVEGLEGVLLDQCTILTAASRLV